jgi:primosomal protein N' (replication factor Y)
MNTLYAEILLSRKMGGDKETLTYEIPENLTGTLQEGDLVEIPLKNRAIRGLVLEIHHLKPLFNTKPVSRKIEDFYSLDSTRLELLKHISRYYFCPLYKALKLFYPANVFTRKRSKQLKDAQPEQNFETPPPFNLTPEQTAALSSLLSGPGQESLLHGITGSGKTEIYRRLTTDCLQENRQALILVPEISLTPQTVAQFQKQFGHNIAILHSRLTTVEKLTYLTNIARGRHQIIVGSRSAIFAPFHKLGLIIIDEEHEDSYKQDQSPRYHVRDIARKLLEIEARRDNRIKLLYGSATPSIETYHRALNGEIQLVEMNERVPHKTKTHALPVIHLVDLREELRKKNFSPFSEILLEKIRHTLEHKEQVILFLNRRGSASAVVCRDCGQSETCPRCSVSLTYHTRLTRENTILPAQKLICHHCGRIFPVPTSCKNCGSHLIKYIGLGTQKIEEEISRQFPEARILRADRDTTGKKDDFENIYNTFRKGQADILVGTQMIGKGLHLPNVTLVGVILADSSLFLPDFRAAEKTFQLITQVAGRSGREKPGEVVIQTYLPEHYAIQNTLKQDFRSFYRQEISNREAAQFPPFRKLAKLTVEHPDQEKCYYLSQSIFAGLQNFRELSPDLVAEITLYPAFIPRLKNRYRWQILLSGSNPQLFLHNFFLQNRPVNDIKIDVDPIHTI